MAEPMVPTPINPRVRPCRSHGKRWATNSFWDHLADALILEREGQPFGEREHNREHVLGNRHRLDAASVADQDASSKKLGQAQGLDGDG